ncbi:DnaD domain-containing protein [Anaerophilus nitritogenes]|uniref:DnaD domain-containing protein n=1 Tax=Anaerophilus nitritogenes TaxID=2498136 RepID=UPI00101B631B|nr:DnaD domain protein [Anaerophilus nitritogenes]
MLFIQQTTEMDLGDTPIENIFINDFMPMANGTYVKVYLLGFKYAHDKDLSLSINHQTIARHLSIPLSDVFDAWDFWEQKGIIKKHSSDDASEYSIEFLNLKQLYIDNNFKAINISTEDEKPSIYSCSTSDLMEANKVPEIKEMFYNINQTIRRGLVPKEMMEILEWIYNYNMDPDLIVRAFMYSVEHKKIKNIKYIGAIIRNWYDQGITNMDKLDDYLEKTDLRYVQYRKIFKALGFSVREPSEAERNAINQWIDEWKFDMDIILKACENSKKTPNPNINYIHSILHAWKNDNVQKVSDIKDKKNITPSPKRQIKPSSNKFHNFEQRTSKYTKDELENLLRKK